MRGGGEGAEDAVGQLEGDAEAEAGARDLMDQPGLLRVHAPSVGEPDRGRGQGQSAGVHGEEGKPAIVAAPDQDGEEREQLDDSRPTEHRLDPRHGA